MNFLLLVLLLVVLTWFNTIEAGERDPFLRQRTPREQVRRQPEQPTRPNAVDVATPTRPSRPSGVGQRINNPRRPNAVDVAAPTRPSHPSGVDERINNPRRPTRLHNRVHKTRQAHILSRTRSHSQPITNTATSQDVTYFGGPIVTGPITMHVVSWGPVSGVNLAPEMSSFLAAIGGTDWWNIMLQYGTPSQPLISNSSLTVLPPVSLVDINSTDVDDTLIQSTLTHAIMKGQLTLSDNLQDIFLVLFPPSVSITMQGLGSCAFFCSYHGTISINGTDLGYISFPDQGGACFGGCGAASSVLDNSFSVLSHELAETVTDVAVGFATTFAAPLAWYSQAANGEIADICNAQQGTTLGTDGVTYVVQKLWSNQHGACVSGASLPVPTGFPTLGPVNGSDPLIGTCAHNLCQLGVNLTIGCSPAVDIICNADPFCCNNHWDSTCVNEVGTKVGLSCTPTLAPTTPAPTTATASPTTPIPTNGTVDPLIGTCAHSLCQTGVKLVRGCSPAVDIICATDGFCCNDNWDITCVMEVLTTANLSCSQSATPTPTPTPTSPPTPNPLNGTCAHNLCHIGVMLTPGCSPTVNTICGVDPFCCDTEWDRICVSEVSSVANLTCPKPTPTPTPTPTPSPLIGNCSHSLCVPGVNLALGCSPSVDLICSQDEFCCKTFWDRVCVFEVGSMAGLSCAIPTEAPTPVPTTQVPTTAPTTQAPTQAPTILPTLPPTTVPPSTATPTIPTNSTGSDPLVGSCSHSPCETGAKLVSGCSPAVTLICAADSFCCTNQWDSTCVSEVVSKAGMTCPTPSPDPLFCSCVHSVCKTGVKLSVGCSPTVDTICATDTFCCNTKWDAACVNQVATKAKLSCPTSAPTTDAPTAEPTQAPTTNTTEAPTTEAPTTEGPTTEVPTTEAPTTEAPTTEVPTSSAPTTSVPPTEAPTDAPSDFPTAIPNDAPTPTPTPVYPNPLIGSCSHNLCKTGEKLLKGCSPAVDTICNADPFCCNVNASAR